MIATFITGFVVGMLATLFVLGVIANKIPLPF